MGNGRPPDGWATIQAPGWLGGGDPKKWFKEAGFRTRAQDSVFHVKTDESYRRVEPNLVRVEHLYATGQFDTLDTLASRSERVEVALDDPRIRTEIDRLVAEESPDLTRGLYRQQALLSPAGCSVAQLPQMARDTIRDLEESRFADRHGRPFNQVGMFLVTAQLPLLFRTKFPSVILRIANDPSLQAGDTRGLQELMDRRQVVFAAGEGFSQGVNLMDVYVAPLLGSTSPSIWGIASARTFGMLVTTLGRGVSGTMPSPGHALELIAPSAAAETGPKPVPTHVLVNQSAALEWWVWGLNKMFGVLTDYSNFTDKAGMYVPARHLSDLATVDQLFRRISAILVQHGQVDSRLALLFTCVDTLEALNGKNHLVMFSASHARKTLNRLEATLPLQAQATLLPVARRAVAALERVQDGFFLAAQNGQPHVLLDDRPVLLEEAAAKYLYHLRNATHGHGGAGKKQQSEYATLLANHTGTIPTDLPGLAMLYLIDFLAHPDRLKSVLTSPKRR